MGVELAALMMVVMGLALIVFRRSLGRMGWKQRSTVRRYIRAWPDDEQNVRLTAFTGWLALIVGAIALMTSLLV